jgi:hypothetical protein
VSWNEVGQIILIGVTWAASAVLAPLVLSWLKDKRDRVRAKVERREEFQHRNAVELQDALYELGALTGPIHLQIFESGTIQRFMDPEVRSKSFDVDRLSSRVTDETIRAQSEIVKLGAISLVTNDKELDPETFNRQSNGFINELNKANELLGRFIRDL